MVFMAYNIKREHRRVCKYCGNIYSTNAKHSKVCQNCAFQNHQRKVERTLFTIVRTKLMNWSINIRNYIVIHS